ncbi:hypothetical protein ACFWPV_10065 [Streptomyces uncialis]|uniref:Lsr2 family DNA-binding protein n=1 Tax=Streptomyces uncialis TaxID=1048205 RepID=UPI003660DE09
MTIAALRALLDEELPHIPRHPAPRPPLHRNTTQETPAMHEPQPTREAPAYPESAPPKIPVAQLLRWADTHHDPDIQDQAARARVILVGLNQRHHRDTELTAIASKKEELEQQMAELIARESELNPPKARRRSKTTVDYDSATVRAWARANNVPCTATGRPPTKVVDAWRAATQGPA